MNGIKHSANTNLEHMIYYNDMKRKTMLNELKGNNGIVIKQTNSNIKTNRKRYYLRKE